MIRVKNLGMLRDLVSERVELSSKEGKGFVDLNDLDVSKLTSLDSAIQDSHLPIDVSRWDVSNMESTFDAFKGCSFVGSLKNWNVSKIKNMRLMFCACTFNEPQDFSKWDVANCENFQAMFNGAKGEFLGIERWDVSSAKTIKYMFLGERGRFCDSIDVASWRLNDECERKEFIEEVDVDMKRGFYRREVDFDEFQMLCQKRKLDKLNVFEQGSKKRVL